MRIALANHTPVIGSGSGTYTAMLARGLVRAGHEVYVLTPSAEKCPIDEGVATLSFQCPSEDFPSFTGHFLSTTTYDRLGEPALEAWLAAWSDAFAKLKRTWAPEIVHVQHLWIVARAALSAGLRPVVTCHGSEIRFAAEHPAQLRIVMPNVTDTLALIHISNEVARSANSLLQRVRDHRQVIMPNPYDDTMFFPSSDYREDVTPWCIGFVGRLVPYKNCDQFLECVRQLQHSIPGLTARIIGDGPERVRLEEVAESLHLGRLVRFLGHIPQASLRQHYQSLNAVVVPSNHEPFGLVALEAAACGTPVVVARSGGLRELIHPPFILGYRTGNMKELIRRAVEAMRQSRDPSFRGRSHHYVQLHYSLRSYIEHLESIYRSVRIR